MFGRRILVAVVIGLGVQVAATVRDAGGSDPDPRFATTIASRIAGKPVRLVLTGTALRTKYGFSVYSIGSYVQEGVKVRSGEELARIAAPKQLGLIFERDVDGASIASSFRESIGVSHPAPAYAAELAKLDAYVQAHPVKRGNQIWLTYVPGVGLGCQLAGKPGTMVENVGFAQAVWEVYLGPRNLGIAIKTGLTSRL